MNYFKEYISPALSNKTIVIVLLIIASVIPYLNTLQNDFAYDDIDYFVSWESIRNVDIGLFFAGDAPVGFYHIYRPLRSIFHSILYQFIGDSPFGYHIIAIAIHFLSTLLIYLITIKIAGRKVAFFTGIIFAVLPVHTESITFLIGSLNTVGIIFLLGSFYCYIKFQETNGKKLFYCSLSLGIAAFFTYELTLILPLFLLLFDFCFIDLNDKKIFIDRIKKYHLWFFGSASIFFIIRSAVLSGIHTASTLIKIDFVSRMFTAPKALIRYIYLTIINTPLSLYHPIEVVNTIDIKVLGAFLAIIGLFILGFYFYKRNLKIYTFIIFWFFISLIPVSNIVQIASFMNENYLYLASFSWALLLGLLVYKMYSLMLEKNVGLSIIVLVLFFSLIGFYGYITWERNRDWKNEKTLWLATLEQHPNYVKAYNNLGYYYSNKGHFEKAVEYYEKALEIQPIYSIAYSGLGEVALRQGAYEKAVVNFERAIEINPNKAGNYNSLGIAYVQLKEVEKAEENFKKALEIQPFLFESNFNLAVIYIGKNDFKEALNLFEKANKVRGTEAQVLFGIGMANLGLGNEAVAEEYFNKALDADPNFKPAQEFLNKLNSEF